MARHTWLRLGGAAQYFVRPRNTGELQEAVRRCREHGVPVHVLGGGANLLVADAGVRGAVIHLQHGEFTEVTFGGEGVKAGAGADLSKIVLACVRRGLSGMECLAGIPGSVGGCVKMNAGGAFGDIGNTVESVEVMTDHGEVFTRYRADLAFAYRSTNISAKFILGAEFRLSEDDPQRILKQIKQIWILKKNSQPLGPGNAGCIFKNPRGLSAGALIDRSGLKGRRVGGAYVSEKHANFILAETDAKASDVLELIDIIRETVYEKHEVHLELEIDIWR